MNICFITKEYPPETGWGGIGSYTRDIALLLTKQGHTVVVISQGGQQDTYTNDLGVHVYRVKPRMNMNQIPIFWRLNRIWNGHRLAVCLKFMKLLKDYKFDILETPDIHGECVLIFILWFLKITKGFAPIIRMHTASKITIQFYKKKNIQYYKSVFAENISFMLCKHYSAPSNMIWEAEKRLYSVLQLKEAHIISNPLFLKKECENKGHENIILFVGRLEYSKGIDLFLGLIRELGSEYQYLAIGKVTDFAEKEIDKLPSELRKHVILYEHCTREKLMRFYTNALIGVCPTRWESFGYVIAEMMYCGLPTIISDKTGIAEDTISGKHNLQFKSENMADLVTKTRTMLSDQVLRQTISREGSLFVRTKYSPKVIVKQMESFYRKVINEVHV